MLVYPNKSFIYKKFLPEEYICQFRPAFDVYKSKFQERIHDLYEILKNEEDVYYKTDTHINFKGSYIVYKYFISVLNEKLSVNLIPISIEINCKKCELKTLKYSLGDLTWEQNLGNQKLDNIQDTFYYSDEINMLYCNYKIDNESNIRFLDYEMNDNTLLLDNTIVSWDIVSNYIINVKNSGKIPMKVLVFYDSFLLHSISLYFDIFDEAYFVKDAYSNELISKIQPDYVFEFRVERFLY